MGCEPEGVFSSRSPSLLSYEVSWRLDSAKETRGSFTFPSLTSESSEIALCAEPCAAVALRVSAASATHDAISDFENPSRVTSSSRESALTAPRQAMTSRNPARQRYQHHLQALVPWPLSLAHRSLTGWSGFRSFHRRMRWRADRGCVDTDQLGMPSYLRRKPYNCLYELPEDYWGATHLADNPWCLRVPAQCTVILSTR